MTDKIFADGFIAKRSDNAPDYVIVNLSVKVGEAMEFLNRNQSNGWCNLAVKRGKSGKLYVELDTFKPTQGDYGKQGMQEARAALQPKPDTQAQAFDDDPIPF